MDEISITISLDTRDRLLFYKAIGWTYDDLLNNLMDFVDCIGTSSCSWNDFKTNKMNFYGYRKHLTRLWITNNTAKKLEAIRKEGELINDVIRYLIVHFNCCYGYHRPKHTFTISVYRKTKSKFFFLKPRVMTTNKFMLMVLEHFERTYHGVGEWF